MTEWWPLIILMIAYTVTQLLPVIFACANKEIECDITYCIKRGISIHYKDCKKNNNSTVREDFAELESKRNR